MTQWDIGLTIYETDEELERIAPLNAAVEAARGRVRAYVKEHSDTWAGTWTITNTARRSSVSRLGRPRAAS